MKSFFQIVCAAFFGIFWFVVLTTYIEEHTFTFHKKYERNVKNIMPEGWRFFTKSPRDFRYEAYVVSGQAQNGLVAEKHPRSRNASPANWMGANRGARAMGGEIGLLMQELPEDNWLALKSKPQQLDQSLSQHLSNDTAFFPRIINLTPGAYLQDSVVIVRSRAIPWAWIRSQKQVEYEYFPLRVIAKK